MGFQYVQIFGTSNVTATIKQISVYTGYYIQQAKEDGDTSALPISLQNFSDGIMETAHKVTKSGNLLCGGRSGPMTSIEHQESILAQQMMNNILKIKTNESIKAMSSATKVKRKSTSENQESFTTKIKLGVS